MANDGGYRVNPADRTHDITRLAPLSEQNKREKKRKFPKKKANSPQEIDFEHLEGIEDEPKDENENQNDEKTSMDFYA